MAFDAVVSKIGGVAEHISSKTSRVGSVLSVFDESSSSIRDRYTQGFFGDTNKFNPFVFSRLFDEPTYLTFKIVFNFSDHLPQNQMSSVGAAAEAQYDLLPEPFLAINANVYKTHVVNKADAIEYIQKGTSGYSTWNYLKNYMGENARANSLLLFINGLKDIQENYPYYFQSIEGLGDLMKVDPASGIRIKDGEGIITIKCLEGLDLKITQLMQLYRKIVWDDVYQRWMLPDMMRYFTMRIYVSEIRLFHSASNNRVGKQDSEVYDLASVLNMTSVSEDKSLLSSIDRMLDNASAVSAQILGTNSAVTKILNSANNVVDNVGRVKNAVDTVLSFPDAYAKMCNNAINDVMPTICYECHQCEFMIDDTLNHINSLSASNSKEPTAPSIKIKVGRLIDKQVYPLNANLTAVSDGLHKKYRLDASNENNLYAPGAYLDDEILQDNNYNYDLNTVDKMINGETKISSGLYRISGFYEGYVTDGQGSPILADNKLDTSNSGTLSYQNMSSSKTAKGVTMMSLTRNVLELFAPKDVFSAATSVKEIKSSIDTGFYNTMIKSTATSEEAQAKLKLFAMTNALETLSRSTATNDTALSRLSREMLKELQAQANEFASKATEADNETINNVRGAYE